MHVTLIQDRSYYQTLHKTELIEALLQRDSALLASQQEVIKLTQEFKRMQRILNLRNKKLFGGIPVKIQILMIRR